MTRVPVACVLALLVAGCVSNKIDVVESGVRPDLRARGLAFAPESQGAGPMAKTLQAGERIVFGATVELEDEDSGNTKSYQIVGDDEADIKENRISISSPLARSLIGKFEGDEVTCPAPKGLIHYAIISVKYV